MAYVINRTLGPVFEAEPTEDEQTQEYVYEDVDLGGESWNYRLCWNDLAGVWQLDVWSSEVDDQDAPVKAIYGKRMVPNWPLHFRHVGRRPPGGVMVLLDMGDPSAREQCTYTGLGYNWHLVWMVDDGTTAAEERPWEITVP